MTAPAVQLAPAASRLPEREPFPVQPRIVAFGGGTGLPVLLRGLRTAFSRALNGHASVLRDRLTAVVTVSDDGGSSGPLRRAYPIVAPGDIRNCLVALSGDKSGLRELFEFRFNGEVGCHSLGNLILTALSQLESDFPAAVRRAADLLQADGHVLPATSDNVVLVAEFADGSRVRGESRIARARLPIRRLWLEPEAVRPLPETIMAIRQADLVVIGPGSLYTSIIPPLLTPNVAAAIASSRAQVVVVLNLMTEPGETDGYAGPDFVSALRLHAPALPIHAILVNDAPIPPTTLRQYAVRGAAPIRVEREELERMGCAILDTDLLDAGGKIRHCPDKLARAVLAIADGNSV